MNDFLRLNWVDLLRFIQTAIVAIVAVIFIVLEERNINRYEYDEKRYQKEEERFNKVLEEASDEELLIVLNTPSSCAKLLGH